jgi:hypothetical protein
MCGVCAESDDFEDASQDLLSRAASAAVKATDAIKEAADEIGRFSDQQRRSVSAGARDSTRATARALARGGHAARTQAH